jgi:hypothetical protein
VGRSPTDMTNLLLLIAIVAALLVLLTLWGSEIFK